MPTIEAVRSDVQGSLVLSPTFINGVIDYFMPVVLPQIADSLKAIPLPRIAGHTIHATDFWINGSNNNALTVSGSLVKLSTTAASRSPTTYLSMTDRQTIRAKTSTQSIDEPVLTVVNETVQIDVTGTSSDLEYRFRIDNGAWSVWKARSSINLERILGGAHTVDVCGRTVLMKQEVGCPSVDFDTYVQ